MENKSNRYELKGKVWIYPFPEATAWHFVTLPQEISEEIKFLFGENSRGWGSLPVKVTIGNTNWKTSIFSDKKSKSYVLPLKAEVRKKENIKENDVANFTIEIIN